MHARQRIMSRTSLRYCAGYSLVILTRLLRKVLEPMWHVASLPEQFSLIIWTPSEIDRFARTDWNGRTTVQAYASREDWLHETEKSLLEKYFAKRDTLLNLACGAR